MLLRNKQLMIYTVTCKFACVCILAILITLLSSANVGLKAEAASVWNENRQVRVGNVSKDVKLVFVNPSNKRIEIRHVLADDQIGRTESLESMAKRMGAIAAINGTFFNAYTDDKQPHGVIQHNGHLLHNGTTGSVAGITGEQRLVIANVLPQIAGSKNGTAYGWSAWGLNHDTTTAFPTAVMIFTPEYKGQMTAGENAKSVVVEHGKVTAIVEQHVTIPENGYIIRVGNQVSDYLANYFQVGDIVDYRVEYTATTPSETVDWGRVRYAVGAGPILIHKGQVAIDFERDKMPDPKLTTEAGMRSFIGIRSDGVIGIGSVNSVTISQLAQIAKELGFVEAMNLDGGASSGIYYRGAYLRQPGRELSNALVIIEHPQPIPRIAVNGTELFLDVLPYMGFVQGDSERGVTMIPVRGVLEQTGADITWNGSDRAVVAKRGDILIELQVDSQIAKVNGKEFYLEVPATIRGNRVFIPIRFMSEALGDSVSWDQRAYMVSIRENTNQ